MKKSILAITAALIATAPLPAFAQGIPVHDNANLLQQINAVRQAIQVVAQGKQQIAEAQKLYQDFNKLTDISQLAQSLKTDVLHELDTSAQGLQGFGNGNLDVVGAARTQANKVYQDLLTQLGKGGSDQYRQSFDLEARNLGIQSALSENVGAAVTSRSQGLDELRARLATASTAKEVSDLTARLQLETAQMTNDNLRLQAISMQQDAQARIRAAAGRAALIQSREAANRYFRGEK
jgi:type IV secretion system protein VirB5